MVEAEQVQWVEDTIANAAVAAAHERTMHLHKVAVAGALAIKQRLPGAEKRWQTRSIEYGRLVPLGPIREWTEYTWESTPVHIGEAVEERGLKHEFRALKVDGTIETSTRHTLLGSKKTESLKGEHYQIEKFLGDDPNNPENTIVIPREPFEGYLDRSRMCRDARPYRAFTQEQQLDDYDKRQDKIVSFLRELWPLINAAGLSEDLEFSAAHIHYQLQDISGIPNRNTLT